MSKIYNWSTTPILHQTAGYAETVYPDGRYDVSIGGNTTESVEKIFSSIPLTGQYTHEYRIPKLTVTGDTAATADWEIGYELKYGGNTRFFRIGAQKLSTYGGCAAYVTFSNVSAGYNFPLTGNASYDISVKYNSVSGIFAFDAIMYDNSGTIVDQYHTTGSDTGAPGNISTDMIENHYYRSYVDDIQCVIATPPIVKGLYCPEDIVIYADISDNTPNGAGTTASPYNFGQLTVDIQNNLSDTGIASDIYTYRIKGVHNHPSSEKSMFGPIGLTPNSNLFTRSKVIFKGWNIDTYGPPIFRWNYDPTSPAGIQCGDVSWFSVYGSPDIEGSLIIEFQDIIVQSSTLFNCAINLPIITYTKIISLDVIYKNVHIVANDIYTDIGVVESPRYMDRDITFYGCSFNCDTLYFRGISRVGIYDSTIYAEKLLSSWGENGNIAPSSKVSMNNYMVSTKDIVFSPETDITGFVYNDSMYNKHLRGVPNYDNFGVFVDVVTNKGLMFYENFGIPKYNNPAITQVRIDNKYNNGIYGMTRETYGAYVMGEQLQAYSTSGHIGAFYFGGDYSNVDASDTSIVNITPSDYNIGISHSVDIVELDLNLDIPDKQFVIANDNFIIDFVAKEQHSDIYPKFCKAKSDECANTATTDTDWELYNKQITGGNPLIVDFVAYAKTAGIYEHYKPVSYKWYFDYDEANPDNEYVICAGPSATHIYCGGYLEDYDVKLCVEFQ